MKNVAEGILTEVRPITENEGRMKKMGERKLIKLIEGEDQGRMENRYTLVTIVNRKAEGFDETCRMTLRSQSNYSDIENREFSKYYEKPFLLLEESPITVLCNFAGRFPIGKYLYEEDDLSLDLRNTNIIEDDSDIEEGKCSYWFNIKSITASQAEIIAYNRNLIGRKGCLSLKDVLKYVDTPHDKLNHSFARNIFRKRDESANKLRFAIRTLQISQINSLESYRIALSDAMYRLTHLSENSCIHMTEYDIERSASHLMKVIDQLMGISFQPVEK